MGSNVYKVKAPMRAPGKIVRRTDFDYLGGHGTFYKFDDRHFPYDLLSRSIGERVSLVLYNLHTDQLDEVVFELDSRFLVGEKYFWIRGHIADIEDYFEIKIEYNLNKPMTSETLVYASAPPIDYDDYVCP